MQPATRQRFFGKRRATRTSPGGLIGQPFCRLGALVFRLNNSDRLYWASPWAETRIAGCALSLALDCHPPEKRCLRKTHASLAEPHPPDNGGWRRQFPDQFFALHRVCGTGPKTSRRQLRPPPGADASAIHGRTERSGCTAAEPYPLSRAQSLPLPQTRNQANPPKMA